MTNPTPAGWYPDATTPGQQRWWDGTQWTATVQAPYQAGGSTMAALRAPEGTSPSTPHIWLIVAIFALQSIASMIWLATFDWGGYMDATLGSAAYGGLGGYGYMFNAAYFVQLFIGFVAYAGTVALAFFDWKALQARGVVRPFHWAFAFIPSYGSIVYVIGRSVVARRRTGSGMAPMWVFLALLVVSFIGMLVAMFAGMGSMMDGIYSSYGYYGE